MDGKLYKVRSATRVTLSPEAREICKLHGMTEEQMARHLLNQHRLALAQGGEIEPYDEDESYDDRDRRDERRRDYLPYSPQTEYVEDRRKEHYETLDVSVQFRDLEWTPQQALEYQARAGESTPMSRAAGYEDIGQSRPQPHAFKASNPLPPVYLKDPVGYLLRASEFARLNPNYFERRGGAQ